jgi:hypothetical protein
VSYEQDFALAEAIAGDKCELTPISGPGGSRGIGIKGRDQMVVCRVGMTLLGSLGRSPGQYALVGPGLRGLDHPTVLWVE